MEVLTSNGVIPGIKIDKGAKDLAGSTVEKVTEGLDGLRERLAEYRELGAQFTKWRAVITIGEGIPTDYCIDVNAHALARMAALSQEAGLVPIIEPEVLMDGEHDIATCADATERALHATFAACAVQQVDLAGSLLKPNMGALGQERGGTRAGGGRGGGDAAGVPQRGAPRRCPAACSSRADRATRRRRSISMRSIGWLPWRARRGS